MKVPGDFLAGGDDIAHVRVFGLAQRCGYADVDGVQIGHGRKSEVARSFPDSTSGPSVALGTSPTYESPAFTRLAFSWLMSMPVTENPALANSTASGSPTYPRPTIPTRAARVRIFSSSIARITLVFSHI